jgi:hypothetical protein
MFFVCFFWYSPARGKLNPGYKDTILLFLMMLSESSIRYVPGPGLLFSTACDTEPFDHELFFKFYCFVSYYYFVGVMKFF